MAQIISKPEQTDIQTMVDETIQEALFLYNNPEKWEGEEQPLTQKENYNLSVDFIKYELDNLDIYFSNDKDENEASIKYLLDEAIASGRPGVAIGRL